MKRNRIIVILIFILILGGLTIINFYPKKYTVTIINRDENGNATYSEIQVKNGTTISELEIPTMEKYTFLYWTLDGNICDLTFKINENITLEAIFEKNIEELEKNVYTVTIKIDNANIIAKKEVLANNTIPVLNTPTKDGYEFIEWTLNGKTYDFNSPVDKDITLVATWKKKEEKVYTVKFNTNGGNNIASQKVEEKNKVIRPANPQKIGYEFIKWTLNGKTYDFNSPVDKDITLVATWKKKEEKVYTVTFNTNGGNNIASQKVEEKNKVIRPVNPQKIGYEFIEWTLNGKPYDFNSPVNKDITLVATWKKKEYKSAEVKYSLSNTNGRWIFINNPEALYAQHLVDNSGKAIYSDYINGNGEIYFEHYIKDEIGSKGFYALRFYNPTKSTITLNINRCGTTIIRGNGQSYIETWEEYYQFKKCSLAGTSYKIKPNDSQYIYLKTFSTGTGWSDWDCNFTTTIPTGKIPTSIIDGVLNVTSNGKLNVEAFIFQNKNSIPQKSYDHSDNYIDTDKNKFVYSGYYKALPNLKSNITFEIFDNTPNGTLKVKYNVGNTTDRDIWYTNCTGIYAPYNDCYKNDSLQPIVSNNTATNWGNWAIHYTENITIINSGNQKRTLAYFVNAYHAGSNGSSAIVAFPTNKSLKYNYQREGIGKWHQTNEFLKVWQMEVPAQSTITVPTEILLGGNSNGTIGHKIELIK